MDYSFLWCVHPKWCEKCFPHIDIVRASEMFSELQPSKYITHWFSKTRTSLGFGSSTTNFLCIPRQHFIYLYLSLKYSLLKIISFSFIFSPSTQNFCCRRGTRAWEDATPVSGFKYHSQNTLIFDTPGTIL